MVIERVLEDEQKCTGCSSCINSCPKDAIAFVAREGGFLYPQIDKNKCIGCLTCRKTCPVINKTVFTGKSNAFIFQNDDDISRKNSSSGGAFIAIANYILEKKGIVYGAAYDKEFKVYHKGVEDRLELLSLQGSKYVQSDLKKTFREIKRALESNRYVLFVGTPCQVTGLKMFLKNDYENLFCCDFVCHGVPSPSIFRKYVLSIKKTYVNIGAINFRHKKWGYAASSMAIITNDRNVHTIGKKLRSFKKMYFEGLISRDCCYNCDFKTVERVSDMTLFDCWHVDRFNKMWDDDKGTSYIFTHSDKSESLLRYIEKKGRLQQVDLKEAIRLDGAMIEKNDVKHKDWENIMKDDLNGVSYDMLLKKYGKQSLRDIAASIMKPVLYKTSIIRRIKR